MWTITLPLAVPVSTKKWMMLNLNVYRNAHYRDLDKAKKGFADRVFPLVRDLPKLDKVLIAYSLFTPNKRTVDTANVCSVVDKFFSDVLVSAGKLEDDNCKVLPTVTYSWGGIDIDNPRVEANIHPLGPNTNIFIGDGP